MKSVRWSQQDGVGIEHLTIDEHGDDDRGEARIVIESAVAGEQDGHGFGLLYRIECDAHWHATRLAVRLAGGATLDLRRHVHDPSHDPSHDAAGEHVWTDANGVVRDDLRGCIDVDLTATPFTNTLPIRRLRLDEGERHVLRVVWVNVPALTVQAAAQAYTCIEPNRRYRFEGLDTGFTAELTVDDDCIVRDYPGLFRRMS